MKVLRAVTGFNEQTRRVVSFFLRYPIISINNLQDFKPLCDRRGKQPFQRLKMPIRSVILGCQEWSCPFVFVGTRFWW